MKDEKVQTKGKYYGVLKRKNIRSRYKKFIAYDLETTLIKGDDTPQLRYITAYGEDFIVSEKISNIHELKAILVYYFLTEENKGSPFIAWNGNKFDVLFIAKALATIDDEYLVRPYLSKGTNIRGLCVYERPVPEIIRANSGWEFLDGMAMTGMDTVAMSLSNFLATYAPDYEKMDIGLGKGTEFDPDNPTHVKYALRDSVGLYHGMVRCNQIVKEATGLSLTATVGNLGIKYFQRMMPKDVEVYMPPPKAREAIYDKVLRGGFCFLALKYIKTPYQGSTYKYDINQAYAHALREASLPAGRCSHSGKSFIPDSPAIYLVNGTCNSQQDIPFYYKPLDIKKAVFEFNSINKGWITSLEYEQLINEGWDLEILNGYTWLESFKAKNMVDELEKLRLSDPNGPKGPIGLMAKNINNAAYGKFGEQLTGEELVFACGQPDGYHEYRAEDPDYDYIWVRLVEAQNRPYHRPQLAAFITAFVRMEVRRAALLSSDNWIYADTDCIACSKPVENLDIHLTRYGAWKQETFGEEYMFIAKKVYASLDGKTIHAKGMNVKRLNIELMKNWRDGNPPKQTQIHRRNVKQILSGFDMFVTRVKVGQKR